MSFVDLYKKLFAKEDSKLKERIFKNSPFDFAVTEKIWEKYFRFLPLKLALPLQKYGLYKKKF